MSVHDTAVISNMADIDDSVQIGANVIIEEGVKIGPDVKIMSNVYIFKGTEIGEGTIVHIGAVIGNEPQDLSYTGSKTFTKIGKNNVIREYVTIHRGTKEGSSTVLGDNNYLMVNSHVGHNCIIEDNVIIANGVLLAGYVHVEKGVFISGNVVFHQFCRIGKYAMIGGFTGVNKDVPPYMIVRGPSVVRGINLVGLRRSGIKNPIIREIKEAYKLLYVSEYSEEEALEKIRESLSSEECAYLVSFVESSKRGVCKRRFETESYFE